MQWPEEKDRQYNGQRKRTGNDQQSTTQKAKDKTYALLYI